MKNKKIKYGLIASALVGTGAAITYVSSKMADQFMLRQSVAKNPKDIECYSDAKIVNIINSDNQMLCGYLYDNQSDITIVLMHPYGLSSEAMASYVIYFNQQFDCNLLVVDALSHGSSDGKVQALGFNDDIVCWVEYLKQHGHNKIFLYGKEMGANTILNYSKELKVFEEVKGIISDGAYTNVKEILAYRLQSDYFIIKFPFIWLIRLFIKLRYHIELNDLDTVKLIKENTIPTLFIHTQKDVFVPMKQVFDLYNASKGEKELLVLKKETYLFDLKNNEDDNYLNTLHRFINKHSY